MKKVLFVLKDMNVGGVEKSLISLLNEMDFKEYKVTVLLLKNQGGFLNAIPKEVEVKVLEKYEMTESWVNNPPLLEIKKLLSMKHFDMAFKLFAGYIWYKLSRNMTLYYKMAFSEINSMEEEYDIAIAFTSIISYLTYFVKYKVKAPIKVGWIHFDVNKFNIDKKTTFSLHKDLDRIFVVSNEACENFIKIFPELKEKCEVKYNIVSRRYIDQMSQEKIIDAVFDCNYDGIKIITLGRLSKEKGQDIIPKVALMLKNQGVSFKWYLIGDGNLRAELEAEISKKGLGENVILLGTKTNPYPYLRQANLYVQTSVHEGFCISLAEARALYLPIISTEFVGAAEQIKNQITGSIVKREAGVLYKEILKLINNHQIRNEYIANMKAENIKYQIGANYIKIK